MTITSTGCVKQLLFASINPYRVRSDKTAVCQQNGKNVRCALRKMRYTVKSVIVKNMNTRARTFPISVPARLLGVALLLLLSLFVALSPAQAQSKSLEWLRLDADITVLPNGDLQIAETNVINFTNGSFSYGFRDIDMARITDVIDIRAEESGQDLQTEVVNVEGNKLRIKYYFLTPAQDEQRTFVLHYTVQGATRVYAGGDQVFWSVVYADRNGFSVLNSTGTVRLPNGATATNAEAYGARADVKGLNESVVIANALDPIPSGSIFEVRVQFPHGIISGSAPAWQQEFDQQRAYDEQTKPTINLITLLIAALVSIGGPVLAVVLLNTKGRDPNVGMVAEYLNEPPAIEPGLAGTLMDEKADMQDVIATLVDLARRGVLTMAEQPSSQMGGLITTNNWVFSAGEKFNQPLKPFEKRLVDGLGIAAGDKSLSNLRNKFYTNVPKIQNDLYDALVKEGFYNHAPNATRASYSALAVGIVVLAGIAFCVSTVAMAFTDFAICVPFGLGLTAIAFFIIAGKMPARTRKGAEMAMRVAAFKRYMENIEKYTDLNASKDLFDKYLPFAIAFNLDRSWMNKFAKVDAPVPPWYVPMYGPGWGTPRGGMVGAPMAGAGGSLGKIGGGDVGDAARTGGGIEGMSKGMAGGIAGMSVGLSSMFDQVGSTFTSRPQPQSPSTGGWSSGRSGGGWSGGGGGGGGSSGGGGGGFG